MVAIIEKEKVLNLSIIPSEWIAATWEDFLEISQAKDSVGCVSAT